MNRTQFTDTIRKFYDQGLGLIASKNDDYAGDGDPFANFRMAEKMGLTTEQGIMLRLLDKVARLANVHKKGVATVASESLDDTLLDLANYTAILYAFRQSQPKLEIVSYHTGAPNGDITALNYGTSPNNPTA